MNRCFLNSIVISFLILALASCAKKEPRILTLAEVNPPDSIAAKMDQYFADEVKKLTKGEIQIKVYASAMLGDEAVVLDEMYSTASIDMARISLFSLNNRGAEKSKILTIPYIFNNREHFWNFAKSDLATQILLEPSVNKKGVVGVFLAEEGFRHFFSTQQLRGPEDLSGQKIRVSSDIILKNTVTSLGATPVNIAFFDLLRELMVGTVTAAEQPLVNYRANDFHTVAPNLILDGHTIGLIEVVITKSAWSSLGRKNQELIRRAGQRAAGFCREIVEFNERETLNKLKADGVNIVEVTDKAQWKKLCESDILELSSKDPELYKKISELGE